MSKNAVNIAQKIVLQITNNENYCTIKKDRSLALSGLA